MTTRRVPLGGAGGFWRGSPLRAILGVAIGAVLTAGPSPARAEAFPSRAVQEAAPTFHQVHVMNLNIACSDCHGVAPGAAQAGEPAFSVRPYHPQCDSCHAKEFSEMAPVSLCNTCHTATIPEVGPFPTGQSTLTRFSHRQHVDPRLAVHTQQGIRQDCLFCHRVEAATVTPKPADHPECGTCHAGARAAAPELMREGTPEQCMACHSLEKADRNILARDAGRVAQSHHYPGKDVQHLTHGKHLWRRDGGAIACTVCHDPVLRQADIAMRSVLPTMRQCAACHDNARWVPAHSLTKHCQVCHETVRADTRPLAGTSTSAWIAHTETFRRQHEAQARHPDNLCGFCHTQFVNVGINTCAGCHSAMRPRSHQVLRFNGTLHGWLAGFDRKACTSCHTGEYCSTCHNVTPRSHMPLDPFVRGGHRSLASFNVRSCFTCHNFAVSCERCHRRGL